MLRNKIYFIGLALLITSCGEKESSKSFPFSEVPSDHSKIFFKNDLAFDSKFNIYTYRNFYNGGGVALGDINNDGLIDIYFSSNQGPNKLYLNKGNFVFEDISDRAGVSGTRAWSTGVSMADVNGDGWLDIYVCNSGNVDGDDKENELFINNGDLTFTDKANELGVADNGYTTHAVFFDYDKDADLDLYVLNNSFQAIGSFNLQKNERGKRDSLGGHKLLRNDNGHFTDVSEQAGIYGSIIAFGLGVTVGDINKDGWQDIYVSNDFFERDYLYVNNRNGTFKECLPTSMKSISGASMGADLADINNDTYPDLFVTEMLPRENSRLKTITTFENWDRYLYSVTNDYYHQFTRNMVQVNNGNNTFSEIGRLTKTEASDWSWGALMFDTDNDGLKDIFVANGIYKDLTNQDYLQFASSEEFVKSVVDNKRVDYKKLIEIIPSQPVPNCLFHNKGGFEFEEVGTKWGLGNPSFSNGSAYGDLDNDGDLDLVVNNVNMPAFVYKNNAEVFFKDNHYLKFILKGEGKNTEAIGATITVENESNDYYLEQMPMRGFESTVDPRPNFGLGNLKVVERILVKWPDGKVTQLDSVKTNQTIVLEQAKANSTMKDDAAATKPLFSIQSSADFGVDFIHTENAFVDFDRDRLIYHMLSTEGPKISVADVNGDHLDDFYIGGAKDQSGELYVQQTSYKFKKYKGSEFDSDKISEDIGSAFFDADNDGDLDLYVCSGGNEFSTSSNALADRLYINDGKGNYLKSNQILPSGKLESTSCVRAADYDSDGDIDLFVGERLEPFRYGVPMSGHLLVNDGKGSFRESTKGNQSALKDIGMITDARWSDIDNDTDLDLVVIGEWMPISIFINDAGVLNNRTTQAGLANSNGWWNAIESVDVDDDGDMDLIAGNHGLNSRFRASVSEPVTMYVSDFDNNGSVEQILCTYNGNTSYPMVLRHDLVQQIPSLKKKYLKYESYKDQTITDIFTPEQVKDAFKLEAFNFSTSLFLNNGHGAFTESRLPIEAQFSPVYGIATGDYDGDGKIDILMGGNFYKSKPEVGRYDASYGLYLKGDGHGRFAAIKNKESGFFVDGEVRDIENLKIGKSDYVIVSRNNDKPILFKINK